MKTALRCAVCLFALLWLTGCGEARPSLPHAELIEVPVVEYVSLPAALTEPLVAPAAPAFSCVLTNGKPAVCVHDGLMREIEWQAILARANADRATAAFLGVGAGMAPRAQLASSERQLERKESQLLRQPVRTNTPGAEK